MTANPSIAAFVFDIGGVLLNYDLRVVASSLTSDARAIEGILGLRHHPSLPEVESGRLPGEAYVAQCIGPHVPGVTYRRVVEAWKNGFSVNEEGTSLFRALRDAGRRLYLLSNIADFNVVAIEEKYPGFFELPAESFFSYRLGHVKPQPEIYRAVCTRIGAPPEACVFLDDTAECVAGAERVGMRAIHFSSARIDGVRAELRRMAPGVSV